MFAGRGSKNYSYATDCYRSNFRHPSGSYANEGKNNNKKASSKVRFIAVLGGGQLPWKCRRKWTLRTLATMTSTSTTLDVDRKACDRRGEPSHSLRTSSTQCAVWTPQQHKEPSHSLRTYSSQCPVWTSPPPTQGSLGPARRTLALAQ